MHISYSEMFLSASCLFLLQSFRIGRMKAGPESSDRVRSGRGQMRSGLIQVQCNGTTILNLTSKVEITLPICKGLNNHGSPVQTLSDIGRTPIHQVRHTDTGRADTVSCRRGLPDYRICVCGSFISSSNNMVGGTLCPKSQVGRDVHIPLLFKTTYI